MLKYHLSSVVTRLARKMIMRKLCSYVSDNVTVSLAPKYVAPVVESGKYEKWERRSYFAPKFVDGNEKVFSIILPPPNITGTLHLGHALTITIQDILCRWKRMQGYAVLWVPGTDHAGIATQVMVEKNVFSRLGRTRHEIGRKLFFEHLLEWKAIKMNKITDQLKQMGASVDWSKYTFTMDPSQTAAVTEAVIRLFEDGLIFHENSLVNWCCHLQSTISDIEIDYRVLEDPTLLSVPGYEDPIEFGLIYNFAMKVNRSGGDADDEIIVSTTRPETVFGDVAVAVHPDDTRYSHLRDAYLYHPFRKCTIPIIFDEFVNPEFGSGAVKITPGHSKIDFEVSMRHNLSVITVFDEYGRLNDNCGEFIGQPRFTARNQVIAQLADLGLLRDVKTHIVRIPICSRSGDIIEQMIKPQWFLKCDELAKKAMEVVENGDIIIEPSKKQETCIEWLKKNKVWCLSRQLWWGHRLPLYRVDDDWVAAKSPHEAKVKFTYKHKKECSKVEQEKDVLDTWFSSALLPLTVFGWPEINDDFKKFYPLTLMETGADLLTFWVARMVMLGLYFSNEPPFKNVFLHSMICDNLGRKMSKSLGNVIEPNFIINGISLEELNKILEVSYSQGLISSTELQKALQFQKETFPEGIRACGADALRLTLASNAVTDHSTFFNADECLENAFLCNKLWQASKFTIGWACKFNVKPDIQVEPMFLWQRWFLHRLCVTVEDVNASLEAMDFRCAVNSLKCFLIEDFCDKFLELSKPVLKSDSHTEAKVTASIMLYSLVTYLRLLSPIMPYICDEIYTHVPNYSTKLIAECPYPHSDEYSRWKNESVNEEMQLVRKVVRSARFLLQEMRFKKNNCDVVIVSKKRNILDSYRDVILTLIRCRSVEIREPPVGIMGPSFFASNVGTIQVIKNEMTILELDRNFKLLNDQIYHWCSNINKKIDADFHVDCNDCAEESGSDSSNSENLLCCEWKNFEAELNATLRALNVNIITPDVIKTMIEILEKIYKFKIRFKVNQDR